MHKNYEKSNLNYSRKEETGWDGVLKIPLQYDILSNYFLNYGWKNNILVAGFVWEQVGRLYSHM
jgi:hypothetical protein